MVSRNHQELLVDFSKKLFHRLVYYAMVYSDGKMVFTFCNRRKSARRFEDSSGRIPGISRYSAHCFLYGNKPLFLIKYDVGCWVQKITIAILKNRLSLNFTLSNIESAAISIKKTIAAYVWVHLPF